MTPETEIVQTAQVSIIPPTDLPNLDNALKEMERECSALVILGANIKSAQVSDAVRAASWTGCAPNATSTPTKREK
jgi:hypothetical protein